MSHAYIYLVNGKTIGQQNLICRLDVFENYLIFFRFSKKKKSRVHGRILLTHSLTHTHTHTHTHTQST